MCIINNSKINLKTLEITHFLESKSKKRKQRKGEKGLTKQKEFEVSWTRSFVYGLGKTLVYSNGSTFYQSPQELEEVAFLRLFFFSFFKNACYTLSNQLVSKEKQEIEPQTYCATSGDVLA